MPSGEVGWRAERCPAVRWGAVTGGEVPSGEVRFGDRSRGAQW